MIIVNISKRELIIFNYYVTYNAFEVTSQIFKIVSKDTLKEYGIVRVYHARYEAYECQLLSKNFPNQVNITIEILHK